MFIKEAEQEEREVSRLLEIGGEYDADFHKDE